MQEDGNKEACPNDSNPVDGVDEKGVQDDSPPSDGGGSDAAGLNVKKT